MSATDPSNYSNDPEWSDITPLPQDDGGPNALATIAYTPEYSEASSYLRAIMAVPEYSPRALDLTAHLIELNPAHYTVWLYRMKTLEELDVPIEDELEWLNDVSLRYIKNYQIWHHRQVLVTRLAAQLASGEVDGGAGKLQEVMHAELAFLAEMFEKDQKNYHVWSYRQWLVRKFDLWEGYGELEEMERFIRLDVRNNSAWNHRWFLVFGREAPMAKDGGKLSPQTEGWRASEKVWQREVDYAKEAIRLAPQNESPWSFLKALLRRNGVTMAWLAGFAREFAAVEEGSAARAKETESMPKVRSTFALDVLAEAYAEDATMRQEAAYALQLLAERYDTIRKNFWEYKRKKLGLTPWTKSHPDSTAAVG